MSGNILGSYVHGIFDEGNVASTIVECLLNKKGLDSTMINRISFKEYKETQYDLLAESIRQSLDMNEVYRILAEGI